MKIQTFIFVVGLQYYFSQTAYPQMQTVPLLGPPETSLAWSPDSSEIAIGTDQGIFFVNAEDGKISDRFRLEEFEGEPPNFILQIDWRPDGTKLAIVGKPEITIHYPTDVWIIDRNSRIARKVTNSTLYSPITQDEETSTVRSIHYRRAQWTPDGRMLLVFEETIDQTYSNKDISVKPDFITNICPIDPETEAMSDFEGVLPMIQNTERLPDYSAKPDEFSIYEQHLSPDGKKTLIKIDHPGDFYSFIVRGPQ